MSEAGPTQEKTARHGEHHRSDSFGALEDGASFYICSVLVLALGSRPVEWGGGLNGYSLSNSTCSLHAITVLQLTPEQDTEFQGWSKQRSCYPESQT